MRAHRRATTGLPLSRAHHHCHAVPTARTRPSVLYGFAPVSTQAPAGQDEDRIDLLMTTDVLAEGVNLQQARHIINYDLPWNPMRLVQRHGRIDRIGSKHSKVFLRCFFPDRQLDEMLKLEERLKRKLAQAAASIGVESEALPGSQVSDHTFAETREQIEQLRRRTRSCSRRAAKWGARSAARSIARSFGTVWRTSASQSRSAPSHGGRAAA